jgi:predicted O-methyltransferase YrrM
VKHSAVQVLKRFAYRSRSLNWLSRPRYDYNVEPAELAFLVHAIERTSGLEGAIVEIGVARGMTTVFLNEHLAVTGDPRRYLCVDTFSGFTRRDIAYEVDRRGKRHGAYGGFTYLDAGVFSRNLAGYDRVAVLQKDCNELTGSDLGPVSVAFLDVDLYQPTRRALEVLYEAAQPGGVILVDDVRPGGIYDGANAAYDEFCSAMGLEPVIVGTKAGAVYKPV